MQYIKGSAYALSPREIGTFDLVLFLGCALPPALSSVGDRLLRSVSSGEIFVETHVIDHHPWMRGPGGVPTSIKSNADLERTPLWRQYREFELGPKDYSNWFGPNIAGVLEGFQTAGFEIAHTKSWGDRAAFRGHAVAIPARLTQHTYEAFSSNSDFVGLKDLGKASKSS